MDTVEFQNRKYKIREIELPEFGCVFVSTVSLNDAIMGNGSDYVSDEAQKIDEGIYFFVEDDEIELDEKDLIQLVILETA